ncbi:hypothetical protein HBH72_141660 [Parastagonospora nodorum]|nr:hypothetical protein HBH72_141660 [Parastagonospora nodorum]
MGGAWGNSSASCLIPYSTSNSHKEQISETLIPIVHIIKRLRMRVWTALLVSAIFRHAHPAGFIVQITFLVHDRSSQHRENNCTTPQAVTGPGFLRYVTGTNRWD